MSQCVQNTRDIAKSADALDRRGLLDGDLVEVGRTRTLDGILRHFKRGVWLSEAGLKELEQQTAVQNGGDNG